MADRWTVFSHAVKYCLEGWPALHIAHQQGFGGDNFREKLEWLLDVIVQVFKDNGTYDFLKTEPFLFMVGLPLDLTMDFIVSQSH